MRTSLLILILTFGLVIHFSFKHQIKTNAANQNSSITVSNIKDPSFSQLALPSNEPSLATKKSDNQTPVNKTELDVDVDTPTSPEENYQNLLSDMVSRTKTKRANKKTLAPTSVPVATQFIPYQKTNTVTASPMATAAENSLAPLFEKTSEESQFFKVDNTKHTLIQCKKGTLLSIPDNCFIDETGRIVKTPVTIEVKEILDLSDMLLSNLTTMSPYGMLTTDEMICVKALADGKIVRLQKHKGIYIEMPTSKRTADAWICEGRTQHSQAKDGQFIWAASVKQQASLITLPLNLLKFKDFDLGDKILNQLTNPKYEGTLIATREFEERLQYIQANKHIHENRIAPILAYFFRNLHRNLYEVDEMLHRYFASLLEVTPYQDGNRVAEIKAMSEQFKIYAAEKLGKAQHLKPYGVNLNQANAFQQLRNQGLSSKKANQFIQAHQFRQTLINDRLNESLISNPVAKLAARNTFTTYQTGWSSVAISPKLNRPRRKLYTQLSANEKAALNPNVFIAFKNLKTIIPASLDENGQYYFKGLPLGEEALLVALGFKNNQPFTDVVSFTVGESTTQDLSMRATTYDMLQYQLSVLDL